MRGKMVWFNAVKGFGFIRTEEDERLYVHSSGFVPGQVPVGRCADKQVSFEREIADVEGGYQAVGVSILDEIPGSGGRARLRRQR
jgi:cold shock CspA family protein